VSENINIDRFSVLLWSHYKSQPNLSHAVELRVSTGSLNGNMSIFGSRQHKYKYNTMSRETVTDGGVVYG